MKVCKECGLEKPIGEFYRNPPHARGHRTRCKVCLRKAGVEYQADPAIRERRRGQAKERDAQRVRSYDPNQRTLWTYGVTLDEFNARLHQQGGKCAICGTSEPGGKGRWHIDHDHICCPTGRSCGKCIRGLLCARCNPMLGMARDSIETLEAAVVYLQNCAMTDALNSPV